MRIAYLSTEYPPLIYGGLGVYVDNISRNLASLGQKISVFSWGLEALPGRENFGGVEVFRESPEAMKDCMEIFLSPETLAWGEGLKYLLDLFSYNQLSLSDLMREGPFHLVVAHDWLGLPGGMAARRKGIPLIYHVHGLEGGRSERPNPELVALERKGADVADLVITVSEAMKREVVSLGVPAEKVRVCYHGVDTEFFDPERVDPGAVETLRKKYGYAKDDIIVLFVGRLEPVKGVRELFSAMPHVLAEHSRVKLLVVGKGSLETWARGELPKQSNIRLVTDFLDDEEKRLHYALSDLCVFPSLYEPFGIVALEAAAMGKPCVVGAAGTSGLAEIVQNPATEKPTGVHVNARDPKDLAWGINLALADIERLKTWGRNARDRTITEFSWQKAAEKTLEIYEELA
jgi:glycosyltransferase involved in cell wall biosynthesis